MKILIEMSTYRKVYFWLIHFMQFIYIVDAA